MSNFLSLDKGRDREGFVKQSKRERGVCYTEQEI
jgi:hypothetical protein